MKAAGGYSSRIFDATEYQIPQNQRLNGTFSSPISWTPDSPEFYFSCAGRMFVFSRKLQSIRELPPRVTGQLFRRTAHLSFPGMPLRRL